MSFGEGKRAVEERQVAGVSDGRKRGHGAEDEDDASGDERPLGAVGD